MSAQSEIRLSIEDGSVRFIYSDELCDLLREGEAEIKRASHVEPCGAMWTADMSPSCGPLLGPFRTRGEALQAEVEWLKTERNL